MQAQDPDDNVTYPMNAFSLATRFCALISFKQTHMDILDDDTFHRGYLLEGFNFFIHSPLDVLSKNTKMSTSKLNYSTQHSLTPSQKLIDESLRNYDPKV
jgi:hypothetical protein